MSSTVYFTNARATRTRNLLAKISELMEHAGLAQTQKPGGLCAIKLHFGETGNTAFVRPVYLRHFVDAVKQAGAQPFLTDTNTLYVGTRSQSVNHLDTAVRNGFAYSVVGAPVIIADGLRGQNSTSFETGVPECPIAHIASDIVEADSLLAISHFKGHKLTGFGGTLKNLGMGCGSRPGKLSMHSVVSPQVKADKCIACGECITRCPPGAIKLVKRPPDADPAPAHSKLPKMLAQKDPDKCIGCGDCILTCPEEAMGVGWDSEIPAVNRRMVTHARAALTGKQGRALFFNFLTQISPACDCFPYQDAPVVSDLGIMASQDPVALDQASVDLVNQAPGLADSCLKEAHLPGQDKFRDVYPHVDWSVQLEFAQELGMGSREYELIEI